MLHTCSPLDPLSSPSWTRNESPGCGAGQERPPKPDAILNTLYLEELKKSRTLSQGLKSLHVFTKSSNPSTLTRMERKYLLNPPSSHSCRTQDSYRHLWQNRELWPIAAFSTSHKRHFMIYTSDLDIRRPPQSPLLDDFKPSRPIFEEGPDTRSRAPADTRCLIFQSLTTTRDGKELPFDSENARKQADLRAFGFYGVYGEEGQENSPRSTSLKTGMKCSMIYLMCCIMLRSWSRLRGGPPMDGFRGFAEFRGEELERHHLSIPQDEFRDLVNLVLMMQFDLGD